MVKAAVESLPKTGIMINVVQRGEGEGDTQVEGGPDEAGVLTIVIHQVGVGNIYFTERECDIVSVNYLLDGSQRL